MIIDKTEHPGLQLLRDAPYACYLVGSRMVGVFNRDSDYDFLIVTDSLHDGLYNWLKDNRFKADSMSYGTDSRLLSSNIWTREWDDHPNIDLIPVSPKEAEFRLQFFEKMRSAGDHRAGLLARALKKNKAWPHLWNVLSQDKETIVPKMYGSG